MLEIDASIGATYDADSKEWLGPKFVDFYDRNASVGRILFEQMRRCPHSICQISDSEQTSLTYEEALLQAIRVAEHFRKLGLAQRDIVGVVARNTTHLMTVALACFFNGLALHAVNPNLEEKSVKSLFETTKPKYIFFDGQDYAKIVRATNELETKLYTLSNHLPKVPSVKDLLKPTGSEHTFTPAILEDGPNQTLAILCSSGTTGVPKAVTISNHKRFFDMLHFLNSEDVLFVLSTLDWLTGLIMLIASIGFGAKRIITERPFDAGYFLKLIPEYKITFTVIAPPLLAVLLNHQSITVEKLDSLRYLLYGGGNCSTHIQQGLQKYLRHARMIFAYGLTEFEAVLTMNCKLLEKPQAVGRLQPGYKAKIINESGKRLSAGEVGEICCQHSRQWLGYHNNNMATESIYKADGWFHTGDLGFFDTDGYLHVIDRKKNILKYLGMQYCTKEIEEVIVQMPNVTEVCVFGISRDDVGDAAAAAVVKIPGSSLSAPDVIRHVKEHFEATYKHLHGGAVIVEELPKLGNSKLNRKAIKEMFLSSQTRNLNTVF
ncbi:4-coumarate--CoA ligase 1-like [Bactrocera tryoni]|uniref:4-coumarate--CoA ligase 1-like n=1 Tax=Bactrocera tryoni TaxID=59916 RepID=UPI001A95A272|nr:4-coumarate--CoA ligase 1-like [Bactrocera tryoni]